MFAETDRSAGHPRERFSRLPYPRRHVVQFVSPHAGRRFVHQVADFVSGLASGKPAQPDFRNAYETQLVLDAILDSAKARLWREVK